MRGLDRQVYARQICPQNFIKQFFRCFCNRPELSDASVGKDNIQVTELIFNLIED
jgi:hypothetical protein